MKLHFEPNLDFQLQAIESVCDLFCGQEICQSEFTVTRQPVEYQELRAFTEGYLEIGNRLILLEEDIHKNLMEIQRRNILPPSENLTSMDFTVEMETGTGKDICLPTYCT